VFAGAFKGRPWRLHRIKVPRGIVGTGHTESRELLITNYDVQKERGGLDPYEGKIPKLEWHKENGEWFPK